MKLLLLLIGGFMIVSGLVGLGLWYVADSDRGQAIAVIDSYAAYHELAQHERSLISVPGHGETDSRKQLHELLTVILTGDITEVERMQRADGALDALAQLRTDIDAATVVREEIELAINAFQAEQEALHDTTLQQTANELLEGMRARQAIVNEITATLYAVNAQTQALLETIVAESGVLSDEHTHQLNELTSIAEMRFDRLQENYEAFNRNDTQLSALADTFVAHAL